VPVKDYMVYWGQEVEGAFICRALALSTCTLWWGVCEPTPRQALGEEGVSGGGEVVSLNCSSDGSPPVAFVRPRSLADPPATVELELWEAHGGVFTDLDGHVGGGGCRVGEAAARLVAQQEGRVIAAALGRCPGALLGGWYGAAWRHGLRNAPAHATPPGKQNQVREGNTPEGQATPECWVRRALA